jgi:sterol desaturase/sphingolipid hydroxylase (fatty acid hydroxylase superfamily)
MRLPGDLLSLAFCFVLGVPLVEVVGYLWHRFVQHRGLLGEALRQRHFVHHQHEYPAENLRPNRQYQDAKDWSWHILALMTFCLLGLLAWLDFLPFRFMLVLSVGGVVYARYVVGVFHDACHVPQHWLHRFRWFQRLMYLHDLHHWTPCNYGIVFFWMDRLFGTYCENQPSAPINVFPGLVISLWLTLLMRAYEWFFLLAFPIRGLREIANAFRTVFTWVDSR